MTNEWVLCSSVCSLLPLTDSLRPSCPGVLVRLQRAGTNTSKKSGQREKGEDLLAVQRGVSHRLQGEDAAGPWQETRGQGVSRKASFLPISSQLLSQCHVYSFPYGLSIIDPKCLGKELVGQSQQRMLIMYQSTTALRAGTPEYRDMAFPTITIGWRVSGLKQFLEKRCWAKN